MQINYEYKKSLYIQPPPPPKEKKKKKKKGLC